MAEEKKKEDKQKEEKEEEKDSLQEFKFEDKIEEVKNSVPSLKQSGLEKSVSLEQSSQKEEKKGTDKKRQNILLTLPKSIFPA
ncbi:MAG: hypothetical protein V1660_01240 [archaeon]